MMPAPSCPSSIGNGAPQLPLCRAQRSLWHTPLATIRTWTSPGSGGSTWIGSTTIGPPASSTIAPIASSCIRPPARPAGLPILPRVDVGTLRDIADRRYDAFVVALEPMVNVDCGSYTPAGVNVIADMCAVRFGANGWEVERRPHVAIDGEPQLGDLVIGRLRGAGGPNVLLVGHMDTVFDEGTVAERPFRVDGDIARGPGVSDMKGGLLTGFVATEVLQEAGFDGFGTITYVCNPDEEIGSPYSGPVIRELAPQHDAAFVLEGARANGDIVSARKGITDYRITITAVRPTPASSRRRAATRCSRRHTRSWRCKGSTAAGRASP